MPKRSIHPKIIEKIRLLRMQGYSLPEISKHVQIPQTTVFRYIKGIEISPEFLGNWMGKRGGSKKRKLRQEKEAFEEGRKLVGNLTKKEKLLFLSALYWAEGSKHDFGLSNTDPELIKLFTNGLREVFGITNDMIRISVRIYEDLDKERCLLFWSNIVGIPKENFVSVNILKGKKKGKLEYGMCRVRIAKGGILLKKMVGINKAMAIHMSP